jgi:NitT/TauT family transport system permease protein
MSAANEKLGVSLGVRPHRNSEMHATGGVSVAAAFAEDGCTRAEPLPAAARPRAASNAQGSVRRIWRRHRVVIRGAYVILFTLVTWELIGRFLLTSPLMFAPFSAVVVEAAKLWATGELERDILVSFTSLAAGFALAAVIGIIVGSLIAISDAVREHLDPLINALYATPLVALSPILILALGIGTASKVAIVFLLAVFPILINTTAGIKSADESLIEAARAFSASRFAIFRLVLIPSALPFIVAGLRLGIGRGLVGIFIGELFGSRDGLGYLISMSSQSFDVPGMFVGVLVLAMSGIAATAAFEYLEKKIAPWRHFDLKT